MNLSGLKWMSDAVYAGYAARTPAELAQAVLGALRLNLRPTVACCEDMGRAASDYSLHGLLSDVPLPRETPAYLHDHPMIGHVHQMPEFCQVRAVVSREVFERTDYFNGIARPMGFSDHTIIRLQGGIRSVTISLCRDRVFTRNECDLLRLLQRHLAVCWWRVRQSNIPADGFGLRRLIVPPDPAPLNIESGFIMHLRRYFPAWRQTTRLPVLVQDWIRTTRQELEKRLECRLPRVLTAEVADRMLVCRYFPVPGSRVAELHFSERWKYPDSNQGLPGLSPREREVLHWIAEGKRDGEIAVILGLSPKTVGKHVEHVLAKLGVSNRTAAAGLGLRR